MLEILYNQLNIMFKTENKLPIPNMVSLNPAENSSNAYSPGNNEVIRFHVDPATYPMIDCLSSYITYDLQVKDANAKAQFNGNCQSVIRSMRTFINNTEVESIENYNVLAQLKQDYAMSEAERKQRAVFDHQSGLSVLSKGKANPFTNNIVKCVDKMELSGIWGSKTAFSNMAFEEGISLEWRLEEASKCLKVQDNSQNVPVQSFESDGANQITSVVLKPDKVQVNGAYINADPPYANYMYEDDLPFAIGNRIKIDCYQLDDANGPGLARTVADIAITAITRDGTTGLITIGFGATTITGGTIDSKYGNATISLTKGNDGNAITMDYQITNPTLHIRKLDVPPNYMSAMAQDIADGKFMYDVNTYANYKTSLCAGLSNHSVMIPARSTRAKSLMVVPNQLGQAEDFITPYNFGGSFNKLKNYQFQIGQNMRPSRPVEMKNQAYKEEYPVALHNVELDKAVNASGMGTKSLRNFRDNFVIGRSLSSGGSTEDLSPKESLLYLEYYTTDPDNVNNTISAKQVHCFCSHIRRIIANPDGSLQVIY